MTTAQVVETSVTVINSPFEDYIHLDDHASPTYEMPTPGSGCKKHLKIKGALNYYFKTIGYCSRTKVKSRLNL